MQAALTMCTISPCTICVPKNGPIPDDNPAVPRGRLHSVQRVLDAGLAVRGAVLELHQVASTWFVIKCTKTAILYASPACRCPKTHLDYLTSKRPSWETTSAS